MTQTPPISAEQVEAALAAFYATRGGSDSAYIRENFTAHMRNALNAAASIPTRGVAETDIVAWKDVFEFTNARAEVLRAQMPRQVFWALLDDMSYKLRGERAIDPIPASPATPPSTAFQERVAAAHGPLFDGDPTDLAERRDRFGEEANEVQQALGQTREAAHQLVDYTYDRPAGEPKKEIGAAALTLASLCVIGGWDMMECAEADLEKLQRPETIARIRAKRATRHGRGPLPGLSPDTILALRSTK